MAGATANGAGWLLFVIVVTSHYVVISGWHHSDLQLDLRFRLLLLLINVARNDERIGDASSVCLSLDIPMPPVEVPLTTNQTQRESKRTS